MDPGDIRDVLVTHIHLDHAGAAGWWARQGANIHVHPVGAPHIVDPGKLLGKRRSGSTATGWTCSGARRCRPPPIASLPSRTARRFTWGGLDITAVATPGHAWHHHVYCIDDIAFTGDAAGIKLPESHWIDLPAPPPEFNLDVWRETLTKMRGLGLRTLYRTHFGPGDNADAELALFEEVLEQGADWVRKMIEGGPRPRRDGRDLR